MLRRLKKYGNRFINFCDKYARILELALTTIAIIVAALLLWETKEQVNQMKTANEQTRESFETDMRAYVNIESVSQPNHRTFKEGEHLTREFLIVRLKNNGKTPAYQVSVSNIAYCIMEDVSIDSLKARTSYDLDKQTIGGGETLTVEMFVGTQHQFTKLSVQNAYFTIFGKIKYVDIFGKWYETGFCGRYRPYDDEQPSMTFAGECNYMKKYEDKDLK